MLFPCKLLTGGGTPLYPAFTFVIIFVFAFSFIFTFSEIAAAAEQSASFEDVSPVRSTRILPEDHGLSLMGTTGLVTIPVPQRNRRERVLIGIKTGTDEATTYILQGTHYRETRKESRYQLVIPLRPDAELVVNRLHNRIRTTPDRLALTADDALNSFGGKFTGTLEEGDWCLGLQWCAGPAEALGRLDLETLALLRNVYVTFGAELARNCYGYLHVREAFSPEMEFIRPDGIRETRNRQWYSQGGGGVEFRLGARKTHSVFMELIFSDFRSLTPGDNERWNVNGGFRTALGPATLDLLAQSLSGEPIWRAGLSGSY